MGSVIDHRLDYTARGRGSERTAAHLTASSLLFFFAKLLHAKPKHASGEAACREKWARKPEKKKEETADLFVLSGDNEAVKVIFI